MNETATGKPSYKEHRTTIVAGVGAVGLVALVLPNTGSRMNWNSLEGNIALTVGGTILAAIGTMVVGLVISGKARGGCVALGVVGLVTALTALVMAAQKEVEEDSSEARVIRAELAHGTTTNVKVDGDWVTSLRSADAQVELGRSEGIDTDNTVRVFADGSGTIHAQAGANVDTERTTSRREPRMETRTSWCSTWGRTQSRRPSWSAKRSVEKSGASAQASEHERAVTGAPARATARLRTDDG